MRINDIVKSPKLVPVIGSSKITPGFASVFELAALFKIGLMTVLFKAAGALAAIATVRATRNRLTEASQSGRNFI
jgi:hypothetical protein